MQRLSQSISTFGAGGTKGKERDREREQEREDDTNIVHRGDYVDEFGHQQRSHFSNVDQNQSSFSNAGLPPIPQDPRRPASGSMTGRQSGRPESMMAGISSTPSMSNNPPSQRPFQSQAQSPSAALHILPSIAQLLNAHKVYRAGYLWRLDHHSAAASSRLSNSVGTGGGQPQFVRYYMRLEDCILCLWSDEGLKNAQAQGKVIHPTSMNLTEAFVAIASTKKEWIDRCEQFKAPTPYAFVVNTAGANSVVFCTENEMELRRWVNTLRLAIWERSQLETMFTAARLGIREEQQRQPVPSALSLTNNGSKIGRTEALLDVRLPGDTEWKRVYAVLTEPVSYQANKDVTPARIYAQQQSQQGQPMSNSSSTTLKKEKRKSILSGFLGSSGSRQDLAREASSGQNSLNAGAGPIDGDGGGTDGECSPIISNYNTQLEDPATGPTLALFGILAGGGAGTASQPQPGSPNSRQIEGSKSMAGTAATIQLKLTRRPILVVDRVYSANAVWPENEALVQHSKLFKVSGRINWLEQELSSYSSDTQRGPMSAFLDTMQRDNRDAGRGGNQGALLCNLAGSGNELTGPGNAVRNAFKQDPSAETLAWCLAIYDAFNLFGRPQRMIYDQRNPLSPYFAQPAGPARGRLYFDTELVEDLPDIQETRPRDISNNFHQLLHERMVRAGAIPSSSLSRHTQLSDAVGSQNRGPQFQPQQQPIRSTSTYSRQSAADVAPVLPPIGEGGSRAPGPSTYSSKEPVYLRPQTESGVIGDQRSHSFTGNDSTSSIDNLKTISASTPAPYTTPPLIPPSQLTSDTVRDDDKAEQQSESLSMAFEQAMHKRENSTRRGSPDFAITPRSASPPHPPVLRPRSTDGGSRKSSLHDMNTRNGTPRQQNEAAVTSEDAIFLHEDRLQTSNGNRQVSDGSYSTNGNRLTEALSRESTTAGHYNTVPFRSHTPLTTSIINGKPLSLPSRGLLLGQQTGSDSPELTKPQSVQPLETDRRLPEEPTQRDSDKIVSASPVMQPRSPVREEPVQPNEPGAHNAMTLSAQEMTSPTSQGEGRADTGLPPLIQRRAAANEFASPVNSHASDSRPTTRYSTSTINTPTSQAPTSASVYSQNTAVLESIPQTRDSGDETPMSQAPAPMNNTLSSKLDTSQTSYSSSQGSLRYSNAPASAISEGQDDYIAGLNFLALTADHDRPAATQPVMAQSPPHRPPRSPRSMSGSQRPFISIATSSVPGQIQGKSQGYTGASVIPTKVSEMSDKSEGPQSPDSYGTYAEQQQPEGASSSFANRESSLQLEKGTRTGVQEARMYESTTNNVRKPGRGIPGGRGIRKKLGSWSSDEEDSAASNEDDQGEDGEKMTSTVPSEPIAASTNESESEQSSSWMDPGRLQRQLTSSRDSLRPNLPQLPGPSTDPYINRGTEYFAKQGTGSLPEIDNREQYPPNTFNDRHSSMYGWPQQTSMGNLPPWQMQQMQMKGMSPFFGQQPNYSYGHSPSPSMYNGRGPALMQNDTMLNSVLQGSSEDARTNGQGTLSTHGLLQTGLQNQQQRSAANQEAAARENGGPLVQLDYKSQAPQGGLVGAIANHERDRKREGGLGATLTERDRERRASEARQREVDQMQLQRPNNAYGGMPMGAFPGGGSMPMPVGMPGMQHPGMGYGGGHNMDPVQMQQQMAMLMAQNAYLQAMAGFNNPSMGSPAFLNPPFSPHLGPGFTSTGPQAPYAQSYMGAPPSHSPYAYSHHTPSPSHSPQPGQAREGTTGRGATDYAR